MAEVFAAGVDFDNWQPGHDHSPSSEIRTLNG
jgi:hypothetical protein